VPTRMPVVACAAVCALSGSVRGQCERAWVELTDFPSPPSARFEAAFAGYRPEIPDNGDPGFVAGLLFGGRGADGRLLGDTWVWRSAVGGPPRWLSVPPDRNDPPPTANASIVQTRTRGNVLYALSGGLTESGPSNFVWFGNGFLWFLSPIVLPEPRWNHVSASFPTPGESRFVVSAGTELPACGPLLRTSRVLREFPEPSQWLPGPDGPYTNGTWAVSATQLSATQAVIPFGDTRPNACTPFTLQPAVGVLNRLSDATYSWSTLDWSVPPRINYGLASRFVAGKPLYEIVIFGGDLGTFPASDGLFGDTWISDPDTLAFRAIPGPGPSARRARNQLIYDASRDWYVLFGGNDGQALGDTWVLTPYPVVGTQPRSTVVEVGGAAFIEARVGGPGIAARRWQRDGIDLADGPTGRGSTILGSGTESLRIENAALADAGDYRLVVTGSCGNATTAGATLTVFCAADFNRDGFLDFFDFLDFVECFEIDDCSSGREADFNDDGFLDFFDYLEFVAAFEAGC
jgi:hypothetical protein